MVSAISRIKTIMAGIRVQTRVGVPVVLTYVLMVCAKVFPEIPDS